jgi:GT2 family glycosyltransferase
MSRRANGLFPKVFAITLNWNGKDDTLECLASLKKLDYPNYDIIVVDNGSSDGSVEAFRQGYPDVTVIANDTNLGYAEGFNTGLEWAYQHDAAYSLIVNNDTVIDPLALSELVKVAERQPDIGFVSGKVYWYNEPNRLQTAGRLSSPGTLVGGHVASGEVDVGQVDEIREYDFVDDVLLLVRRAVYDRVGGYDPNFFLYYEETDWCARARRAGFRIVYTPHAKIWHKGRIGGADVVLSPIRYYYLWRNRIVFMRRNASLAQFRRFLLWSLWRESLVHAARFARHGKFQHARAHLQGVGSGLLWLWSDWRKSRFGTVDVLLAGVKPTS